MRTDPPAESRIQLPYTIKGRWRLTEKIGQGAFGEIYQGVDLVTNDPVAVKLERWESQKSILRLEVAVLKKMQGCDLVCRFIACGHNHSFNYMVMELLGESLTDLRRRQPEQRFSLSTTARLGRQMLEAIRMIHERGYLHRDIKPSNFALGRPVRRRVGDREYCPRFRCVMFDFGLARRYLTATGDVRPPREVTGFRGTARYASVHSHRMQELSRRDDLWSLLYVLMEFAQGFLPWRRVKDKEQIGKIKDQYNGPQLVELLPPEFLKFMQHIQSIEYADTPDYAYLDSLLKSIQIHEGVQDDAPFDWELPPSSIAAASLSGSHGSNKGGGIRSQSFHGTPMQNDSGGRRGRRPQSSDSNQPRQHSVMEAHLATQNGHQGNKRGTDKENHPRWGPHVAETDPETRSEGPTPCNGLDALPQRASRRMCVSPSGNSPSKRSKNRNSEAYGTVFGTTEDVEGEADIDAGPLYTEVNNAQEYGHGDGCSGANSPVQGYQPGSPSQPKLRRVSRTEATNLDEDTIQSNCGVERPASVPVSGEARSSVLRDSLPDDLRAAYDNARVNGRVLSPEKSHSWNAGQPTAPHESWHGYQTANATPASSTVYNAPEQSRGYAEYLQANGYDASNVAFGKDGSLSSSSPGENAGWEKRDKRATSLPASSNRHHHHNSHLYQTPSLPHPAQENGQYSSAQSVGMPMATSGSRQCGTGTGRGLGGYAESPTDRDRKAAKKTKKGLMSRMRKSFRSILHIEKGSKKKERCASTPNLTE
eukprot:Rmarinus@m.17399